MRKWIQETHSPGVELFRHFLRRFFDSDLVTEPGHMTTALIGAGVMFVPWLEVMIDPLRAKYAWFSHLPTPGPYRMAVAGDTLWLITLMMSAVGLLTAIKWQALFPNQIDYRALGSLPVRPRQVFVAKLLVLLAVVTCVVIGLNAFPGLLFPAISGGRWQIQPYGARVKAYLIASTAACYFFFFGLVALQGVLLIVLRPRAFGRVAGFAQGLAVAVMLILMVGSFSIQPETIASVTRPEVARWLPPVWFLALNQARLGDPDPNMQALAHRAIAALWIAFGLAGASYWMGYRRHRRLQEQGAAGAGKDRQWTGIVLDWLLPRPRQAAVAVFAAKTFARSGQHRMVLMGYGGLGLAIGLSALAGIRTAVDPTKAAAAGFLSFHAILFGALLLGQRHMFSIPVELRANWTFQILESAGAGRADWFRAVDRLVLSSTALLILAIPFPVEFRLLGWRAVAEVVLFGSCALLVYECVFRNWKKLPFTCSYLPGKTPMWIKALQLLGLVSAMQVVNALLLVALFRPVACVAVVGVVLVAWRMLRAARIDTWSELRVQYEDAPDPEIQGLRLLR